MDHDSDRCFRLGRSILYIGVACVTFFPLLGIASSAAALWNVDGSFRRPQEAALFFGAFWASCTVLGIWLIFSYVRSRRYIGPQGVREVGILRVRTVRFDQLSAARWRVVFQGGSLVLRAPDGKLTLYFASFSPADKREMIDLLRNKIDEQIQEGWERFESRIFTPLINSLECSDGESRRGHS